jgi:hypothetical protein
MSRVQSALKFVVAISVLSLLSACSNMPEHAGPPASDPPKALLWVGNSFFYFNNSMHSHYLALARDGDPSPNHRGVSVTISGSGIDWHDMDNYLRPDGIGKYTFQPDNTIVFNKPGRQFDAVVMMDCSQCPVHPQLKSVFTEFVKKNADSAVKNGIRPILFMSWAYKDKPEMTAQLAEAYTTAGKANNAMVIPAGLAFAKVIAKRPDLELYQPDKRHPSLAGTYLAACVSYAAITKKSPVGNKYTAGLPADLVSLLQTSAWETMQDYNRT